MSCWVALLQRAMRLPLLLLFFAASLVAADEHRITPEMVSAALEGQGYKVMSSTRTLLGRVRFVASRDLIWREVVLDLSTGQILRDYAVEFGPHEAPDADTTTMPRGGTVLHDEMTYGTGG